MGWGEVRDLVKRQCGRSLSLDKCSWEGVGK